VFAGLMSDIQGIGGSGSIRCGGRLGYRSLLGGEPSWRSRRACLPAVYRVAQTPPFSKSLEVRGKMDRDTIPRRVQIQESLAGF
jgi:hypothetical protein